MGSKFGAMKVAAKRIGIPFDEYLSHKNAGEKWCHKCHQWKVQTEFSQDGMRGDGYKAICRSCDYRRMKPGPSRKERQQRRLLGFVYCRKCQDWKPVIEVRQGLCREHTNQYARERYATNMNYKHERQQHAHARKWNVKPIPLEGQECILEQFNGKCAYCNNPATTWDHVHPIKKGGNSFPFNIVPACSSCNSSKADKDVVQWLIETKRTVRYELFDRIILEEYYMPH